MKKIIPLLLIIISNSAFAQNCNIGNENITGFSTPPGSILKNYLLGVKYNLSSTGVLTSLNLYGGNTGAQVQMAVYADVAGVPGNLIATSGTATVGSGIISLPVTPTQIAAGNYWIMAVYTTDGLHTLAKTNAANVIYYQDLTFGAAIPTNASGFLNYTGREFTYFMGITCGTLGISGADAVSDFSLYPSPAKDIITIDGDRSVIGATYTITDLFGRPMLTGILNDETSTIDISQLDPGAYLFQVGDQKRKTLKLIKE